MMRQLRQITLRTGALVVSFAPLSMAQRRKVPRFQELHRVRQCFVGFFAWGIIFAIGALSVRAAPLNVYQFTLGSPDGATKGDPFVDGSATPYLKALRAALTGTLVSQTVFTPANATVWGTGGQFGGELYFLSIVEGLPRGALLEERKAVFFQFPNQTEQTYFDVTFYYPLEAYPHTPSTIADGFAHLHFALLTGPGSTGTEGSDVNSIFRTFTSFTSFAGDFNDAQGFSGTADNPPPEVASFIGLQVRYEASYRVILGSEGREWTLLGEETSPRGYRFGTGFTTQGLALIIPLGSVSVTSTVGTISPACGLAHANLDSLWPPNHALVSIAIGGVTEPTVTGVTQDEPVNGLGDGDKSPDAVLQEDGKVLLRAERAGTGNGRVYHVAFTADDGSGGQCTGVVTVCAPHDQGRDNTCIDDGQQYNSLKP